MDKLIVDFLEAQIYFLSLQGIIDYIEYARYISRLYVFFNLNKDFSYVQAIKYVFGGDDDEANASDTEKG